MKITSLIIAIISSLVAMVLIIGAVGDWYKFNRNCADYLKLAGDAPTLERADGFLSMALEWMDYKNLKYGNSALFFKVSQRT